MKIIFYTFLTLFSLQKVSAMRVQCVYDDDFEEESYTRVVVTIEPKDIIPSGPSMTAHYNRLGAAILRDNDCNLRRYLDIKNIQETNLNFVRNIMNKIYEICHSKEAYVDVFFYTPQNQVHTILKEEWSPFQEKINEARNNEIHYYETHFDEYGEFISD
tara:strand:- start:921 stop:1397 length:477 start_codon:yes stop_codon:yes gene_type:complete